MKRIKLLKLKIIKDLKKVIHKNKYVEDIWIYGNFKDIVSDLDLILIYKKKPPKIIFPLYIRELIDDGNVIYIERSNKKKIFLFEQLKIFSVLKRRNFTILINESERKNRNLSSFIERYYYSRLFLDQKIKINKIQLRKLKSLLFSYKTFLKIKLKKNLLSRLKKIEKKV